jgi:phenylalanyl-tRNA synthetase beta chain
MFISWNWLNRHVDLSGLDPHDVGQLFTLKVAELDGIHDVGVGLDAMRTVRIDSVEPIEDAKKLSRVIVHDGDGQRQIVCGAPNVRDATGRTAILAPPGAVMPDGLEIREAEIRGVASAGMLASQKELGLSDDHAGIWLPIGVEPGKALYDAIPVKDVVWEVDNKAITHRPDLWGHYGIAREVAVLTGRALKPLKSRVELGTEERVVVSVEDFVRCPRYTALVIEGVDVQPSPQWLQALLRATGVRPISNVVDLTNFVMLDLGNPTHAFDTRYLATDANDRIAMHVRTADSDETLQTLDGETRHLNDEDLLICDAEKPVALAGIMGGADSEIRHDTTSVLLEAATFQSRTVRRTSARLGLRTDSSARFEKTLDPYLPESAAHHFCAELQKLCPSAKVVTPLVDIARTLPVPEPIRLEPELVSSRLGVNVPVGDIRETLTQLGFGVQDRSDGAMMVQVPSWRATKDVSIVEDLIEEIGRLVGYSNIPPQAPKVVVQAPELPLAKLQERSARRYLSFGSGLHEVMSYGFTWRPMLERLNADLTGRIEMDNTISAELDRMRRYLAPNLLNFAEKNARYESEFGLYEIGRVFTPVAPGVLPNQPRMAGGVLVRRTDEVEGLFREARGIIEGLFEALGRPEVSLRPMKASDIGLRAAWVHPVRSAQFVAGAGDSQVEVGYLSLLHPRARDVVDTGKSSVVLFEVDLDLVLSLSGGAQKYEPLPRYPASTFDVSFEVAASTPSAMLNAAIVEGAASEWLTSCELFGNYHLGEGKKSVSFHLTFRRDDGTLTDDQVHEVVDRLVTHVGTTHGAVLRGG